MRGCGRPLILCPTVCYEGRIWSRRMAYLDKQEEPSLLFFPFDSDTHYKDVSPPTRCIFFKGAFSLFFLPPLRPALQLLLPPSVSPPGFFFLFFWAEPAFKLVCLPILSCYFHGRQSKACKFKRGSLVPHERGWTESDWPGGLFQKPPVCLQLGQVTGYAKHFHKSYFSRV